MSLSDLDRRILATLGDKPADPPQWTPCIARSADWIAARADLDQSYTLGRLLDLEGRGLMVPRDDADARLWRLTEAGCAALGSAPAEADAGEPAAPGVAGWAELEAAVEGALGGPDPGMIAADASEVKAAVLSALRNADLAGWARAAQLEAALLEALTQLSDAVNITGEDVCPICNGTLDGAEPEHFDGCPGLVLTAPAVPSPLTALIAAAGELAAQSGEGEGVDVALRAVVDAARAVSRC